MEDSYGAAAVCRRGHVRSSDLRLSTPGKGMNCEECGAPILQRCPTCNARILGELFVQGVLTVSSWTPNDFCDQCAAPMPWAAWRSRVWHVANQAGKMTTDGRAQLRVEELFGELAARGLELDLDEEVTTWAVILDLVPSLRGHRDLLRPVLSEPAFLRLLGAEPDQQALASD